MNYIEISLLIIIYILSCGYLSSLYIIAGDDLEQKVARVVLMLIFVPGVNTLASIAMTLFIWYESLLGKGKADG